jgi:S-adenosylmethionine:tRNA ribosyltransferase-isomerase
MNLDEIDYALPRDLIAQHPLKQRDRSRLMVLSRSAGTIEHRRFFEIGEYLEAGDVLVINDTKVIPVRLTGRKETGGAAEVLLLGREDGAKTEGEAWECLVRSHRRLKTGSTLDFREGVEGEILERRGDGRYVILFHANGDIVSLLEEIGQSPLPPYIKRSGSSQIEAVDRKRYQTVYAKHEGAVAAPTAGLHFTENLLGQVKARGVEITSLTLHVGLGTFQPIRAHSIEEHHIHAEAYELPASTAASINRAKVEGRRVVSVGTTTTRVLESVASQGDTLKPGRGHVDLFIIPGFQFRVVDALITNFHLPRTTLLLLVSAFAGKPFLMSSYCEAIERGYRFYSYGDAMLVL